MDKKDDVEKDALAVTPDSHLIAADKSEIDSSEEKVGYCNPPKHSRFRRGQSGNPKGRPKGAKGFKRILGDVLNEKVVIREGNQVKKVTKMEAFALTMTNGAIKGNARQATLLMNAIDREFGQDNRENADDIEFIGSDDMLLSDYLKRKEAEILSARRPVIQPDSDATGEADGS